MSSLSRIPFDEAKKRLTVQAIPKSLRQQLAFYLDSFCESNWEYLAERLGVTPQEIEWVRNTVMNCPSGSPTFRLFEKFLVPRDILLEKFLEALETIKNFASVKALTEGYENGSFDSTLKQLTSSNGNTNSLKDQCHASVLDSCRSFDLRYRSSPSFPRSGNYRECPGYNWPRFESENFQMVPSIDGSLPSSDGSSTCGSVEGKFGDSIGCAKFYSDPSSGTNQSDEYRVAFIDAVSRAQNQFSSLSDDIVPQHVADEVLDLSKEGSCRVKSAVKVEPRCQHNGVRYDENPDEYDEGCSRQQSFGQRSCTSCHCRFSRQINDETETRCCERWGSACAGQYSAPFLQANCVLPALPRQEAVKREPLDPDDRAQEIGKDLRSRGNAAVSGDSSCCCSDFCRMNGIAKVDPTGCRVIHMRDNAVQYPPGKRITHPPLKEDINDRDTKKNPDGTSPVRATGSSYGVIQRSPFKKDSRSVRVFVTYADDSKKHMRRVMQLCECLKKNNFSVSLDVRETQLLSQDRIGWHDKRFKVADYVLVLISPKYFLYVTEPEKSKKTPDAELALNTLYIHRCMQAEYMDNNCINKRFIPVLMPDASKSHVPVWLQNTTKYNWPDQYKNLFFYMMYPAHVISEFVMRERSAKMPTVQQSNH